MKEIPFINSIDQVINPGDSIVIVTTGYSHDVNTYKGKYLGIHKNGGVSCSKLLPSRYFVYRDTNDRISRTFFQEKNAKLNEVRKKFSETNPNRYDYYNDPEYLAIEKECADQIETQTEYILTRTTLQRNRIFKLADD